MLRLLIPAVSLVLLLGSPAFAEERPVSELVGDLLADDPLVRKAAAKGLGGRFPQGALATPVLVEALDDENEEVRLAARAAILGLAEEGWREILPILTGGESPEGKLLAKGLYEIARLGPALTPTDLAAAMGKGRTAASRLAWSAVAAIVGRGHMDLRILSEYLRDEDETVRRAAACGVALRGLWVTPGPRGLERLDELLKSTSTELRVLACELTGSLGADEEHRVSALVAGVDGENENVRRACIAALIALGNSVAEPSDELCKALEHVERHPQIRDYEDLHLECVRALGKVGSLEHLQALLNSENEVTRWFGAFGLASRGPEGKEAIPVLVMKLRGDAPARAIYPVLTVHALGLIGREAREALPVVRRHLECTTGRPPRGYKRPGDLWGWRYALAEAVIRIGGPNEETVKILTGGLTEQRRLHWRSRGRAPALILSELGPLAEPALPAMISALGRQGHARLLLASAVGAFGARAKAAVPALVAILGEKVTPPEGSGTVIERILVYGSYHGDPELHRTAAVKALGRIGTAASDATECLESIVAGKSEDRVRYRAAQALRRIRTK